MSVALITGASSGIGAALAEELAQRGHDLALGARRRDELEQVAARCRERGARALAIEADISQQAACEQLVQQTISTYGRLDMLVNNAGITMWARVGNLRDPAIINQVMQVNFMGAVYCTYYALPHLRDSKGRIGYISSMADKIIAPGNSGYVASKHAAEGFFESLGAEEPTISISMLYLSFIDTGFAGRMLNAEGQVGAGVAEQLKGTRQLSPAEGAKLVADALERRQRQLTMPVSGLPGWLLPWLKLIAPRLLERAGRRFMEDSGI